MNKSARIAILLLGGSGTRFGGSVPKQFLPVAGKRLFEFPLSVLQQSPMVDEIHLVVREDLLDEVARISVNYSKVRSLIAGGNSREESVKRALEGLERHGVDSSSLILIQDGDRPNLTLDLVALSFEKAEKVGAAVTAIPCGDSLFRSDDETSISQYLSRTGIYLAQTPQTFVFSSLKRAHQSECKATDDGSKVLALGEKVAIVAGSPNNYKINYPCDLDRFKKEAQP